jgi:hypothetical protein
LCKRSHDGATIGIGTLVVVLLLPLSSSMDDGEAFNNASGGGSGSGSGGGGIAHLRQTSWTIFCTFLILGSVNVRVLSVGRGDCASVPNYLGSSNKQLLTSLYSSHDMFVFQQLFLDM